MDEKISKLKEIIKKERKIVDEIINLQKSSQKQISNEERKMILSQIETLKKLLKKTNFEIPDILKNMELEVKFNSLPKKEKLSDYKKSKFDKKHQETKLKKEIDKETEKVKKLEISYLEKETLKRLKRGEKKHVEKKEQKASFFVSFSNSIFAKVSQNLQNESFFSNIRRDLIKANIEVLPVSYISIILMTSFLSIIFSTFIFFFFLFFNFGPAMPIITRATESIINRFFMTFWILFVFPLLTFIFMYFYPYLEKKSSETKIDQELPFAVINMAAISGSLVEPSKIFEIIISTKEYPYLEKEFSKLLNEVNIYGYNLVSALRNTAFNTPSGKLSELLNGLATTITSGGDLPTFFEKRAESLLFEHRLEREKETRASETFMDIYISVVIAAPMILMLLLMMMRISGLGISLSTSMITLLMIMGVGVINVVFLSFLHLKQTGQ